MAAVSKKMRSTSRVQELSGSLPGSPSSLAPLAPAPSTAPGLLFHSTSAESSDIDFVVDLSLPSPPACSRPLLPLSAGPEQSGQALASESALVPLQVPSPLPALPKACDDPLGKVQHYRVPAILSRAQGSTPCPPLSDLSRGYRDGSPVVVALIELERDQFDLRPYLSESMVHLDGLGLSRFRSLLGENPLASDDLRSHLKSTSSVPLWSCSVGGVELVLSCALPVEEVELRRLSRLFAKCRVHIAPGARVVQKPGSPACAWSNRDWCIGCGGEWHTSGLCPLVVRVVRDMVEKGMEVNFDDGLCVKCGYIGHTFGYCHARLDRTMYRLWQAYCARKRRWSCLDLVYSDVELPPLSKTLQEEGCTRELSFPEQRSVPLPLCVRCSRPAGEARELLQEVLERQREEKRKHLERERLQGDDDFPLSRSSALTRLPEDLRLPEPAALAAKDPVRLLSCVSAWQNWCAYGSQEVAQLAHQLVWQVRRTKSLPFGGFPDLGFRIPRALPLLAPAGADEEAWRSEGSHASSNKRRTPASAGERRDPPSRKTGAPPPSGRRPSASYHAGSSRSSGGLRFPSLLGRVFALWVPCPSSNLLCVWVFQCLL
ncbi:hypothetical protein Emag_006867 [Eimeria magna]